MLPPDGESASGGGPRPGSAYNRVVPRVLIVEDERMTRETLRNLVPWSQLGVADVETARDGVDALEKAERRMPDLVVCDIRMPRMGGIEFAQRIRERNPDCGIIFLSGYSDKEYLKAAIRLHAADYIDKPLNLQELGAAVERNVHALRARASSSAEAERARRVLTDLAPILRATFAEELCRPGATPASLRQRHEARVVAPFLAGPLRVALAELERAGADGPPPEDRLKELVRTLNEGAAPAARAAWLAAPDRIGLLAAGEEVQSDERFEALLAGVAGPIERAFPEAHLRFGVGPAAATPEGAPSSCAAAAAALAMRFYAPAQRFLRPPAEPAPPAPPALDEGLADQLRAALQAGELDGAVAVLRELASRAQHALSPRTASVGEAYRRVLRFVLEEARGWEPAEVRVEQERMQEAVRAQRTLAGLAALAEGLLRRCFAPGSGGAAAERRIARIKEYVRTHHADPDLLVETIAAGVGLSESYLCTVFKQACGITVKDHLTQVRIDRAKQLLRDTADKLQAVALQVGFRDANYFSTVFKREVGLTPREFRERALR
jgi:two-component system, response regulator YesN